MRCLNVWVQVWLQRPSATLLRNRASKRRAGPRAVLRRHCDVGIRGHVTVITIASRTHYSTWQEPPRLTGGSVTPLLKALPLLPVPLP